MNSENFTFQHLQLLAAEDLKQLTKRVVGAVNISRLWLGRCIMALDYEYTACSLGYSGGIHVAVSLGVDRREALEARRVARELEGLPVLRAEAEKGTVSWASLREIVRKASPDTEERWLELAGELNSARIEQLVARTGRGEMPGVGGPDREEPVITELRAQFDDTEMAIIESAMRSLSEEAARPLGFKEALLTYSIHRISGSENPSEATIRRIYAEAERDDAAQEAPWAAVSVEEEPAPDDCEVALARPARVPHWENPRVQFNEKARGLTPAQRTEVLRRDRYRCSTPNCPNHLWLQVHHIVFYCAGGATVPANLAVCCGRCHSNIHDGFLQVVGQAPEGLSWSTCDGSSLEVLKPASGFELLPGFVHTATS